MQTIIIECTETNIRKASSSDVNAQGQYVKTDVTVSTRHFLINDAVPCSVKRTMIEETVSAEKLEKSRKYSIECFIDGEIVEETRAVNFMKSLLQLREGDFDDRKDMYGIFKDVPPLVA